MSNFIPDRGTLFYVSVRPRTSQVIEDEFGDARVKDFVIEDRSYREDIFLCVARDSSHLVAKKVVGLGSSMKETPSLFRCMDYNFSPVGPEVAQALGIANTSFND